MWKWTGRLRVVMVTALLVAMVLPLLTAPETWLIATPALCVFAGLLFLVTSLAERRIRKRQERMARFEWEP